MFGEVGLGWVRFIWKGQGQVSLVRLVQIRLGSVTSG
jgi:hypothetical protein